MADYSTLVLEAVPESSTPTISFAIRWGDGHLAVLGDFASAVVSVFELSTDTNINGREHQSILANPSFTLEDLHENEETFCRITWHLAAADTQCITGNEREEHDASFIFVRTTGERCPFTLQLPIVNLGHIP